MQTLQDLFNMTAEDAVKEAISLANLGSLPEGPKGQLEAIGLAQAYALISIAKSLLIDVTGEVQDRAVIRTFSTNSRYE